MSKRRFISLPVYDVRSVSSAVVKTAINVESVAYLREDPMDPNVTSVYFKTGCPLTYCVVCLPYLETLAIFNEE